jgi:hypothetical protein
MEDTVIPFSIISSKKVVDGKLQGISDNNNPVNKYIDKYIQDHRFLEYDVKEEQKDYPPFSRAVI